MKKIGVGIIGVGAIAYSAHIKPLRDCKDAEVVAICDIDQNRLNQIGDEFGIDIEYRFTDYKKLIMCDKVDAVEVCTPNYLHVQMALDAVNAGKPINIERSRGVLSLTPEQKYRQAHSTNPPMQF